MLNLPTIFGNIVMEAELFLLEFGQWGSHDELVGQIGAVRYGIFCACSRRDRSLTAIVVLTNFC
jgi:hypothetical protein